MTPDASPLLRHLDKCLSPEQTAIEARRIWIEALAQHSCDIELITALPHPDWAIPTAVDGLCELRPREVYEHLKIMRPDLVGWAPDGKEANRMLIHVAMRNCWMDELESFLQSNGAQCLAAAAIKYGHADLLEEFFAGFRPDCDSGLDTWEWLCDTFSWTGVDCTDMVVPRVTSVDGATRVLARASSISYKLLTKPTAKDDLRKIFAILWYCFDQLNIGNGVLWEGLAKACSNWHTATAKKVWRRITERDPSHSAQTARVVSFLKTSFTRSIENNNLDMVAFLCDSGIMKPCQGDVGLAVRHRCLDILRYFSDATSCPKSVAARDLSLAFWFWNKSKDEFQVSATVFDFVMEHFDIVGQKPQVVYKRADRSTLLMRATRDMTDQRLKAYIRDSRYRRDLLAK
ncbi:hypothetical protein HK405_011210 [Cladochytrium tenue]|nr:hypothetical protein HK405_011210 [Cladochytrium tenue]